MQRTPLAMLNPYAREALHHICLWGPEDTVEELREDASPVIMHVMSLCHWFEMPRNY